MVQGMRSHSPISQYLPTRFQTSAAGRLTVISSGMVTYVGGAAAAAAGAPGAPCAGGAAAGAWARAVPHRHTAARAPATTVVPNLFLMRILQAFGRPLDYSALLEPLNRVHGKIKLSQDLLGMLAKRRRCRAYRPRRVRQLNRNPQDLDRS